MNSTATDQNEVNASAEPAPKRRVLDTLPMQARTTGDQAAARSRLVRRLRVILPITALVLVAAFFFNTQSNSVDEAFLKDFEDVASFAVDKQMLSPSFAGTDSSGKPFEISADTAFQHTTQKDVVELERPKAVQGKDAETTVVTADKGLYRTDAKVLELRDSVTLQHDVGDDTYIFRSPAATVSIDDEIVSSDAGVGGSGPDGRALKADRMKAYNGEGRVVLEGNVHMRIYPKSTTSLKNDSDSATPAPALKDVDIETPQ